MNDDAMFRALIVVAVVGLIALAIWHPAPHAPLTVAAHPEPSVPRGAQHRGVVMPRPSTTIVYVVGAVMRPGLYHLGDGARIVDAVRAAGGLRGEADAAAINLAAHTGDGDEIFVPLVGQTSPPVQGKRPRTPRGRTPKLQTAVDVNAASAQALALVPGIGPTLAARIVAIRDADGAFASLDELLDVAGMTQSRLDRARSFLRL